MYSSDELFQCSWEVILVFISLLRSDEWNKHQQGKSEGFDSCDRPSNLTQIGFKSSIFQPCDLEIWLMTSKNYRAPLLHYIKLCTSSQTPQWIRTAVAVRKRSNRFKIGDFLPRVTLKFNGWPWKTIGILFYLCYIKLCASFQSHRWIQT